ncbi:hypothetical protein FRZ61_39980 [Hypericibacter adhaerens]|uniref:Uncharacterized protein n=1 Tax=Hypericibacter adhaerens TaxID=2602016 RepID=A0A5J6N3K3_9PROT|nr:hypothetical protein FRZ61_39980 [Hypericibacter adhaerens]
MPKPPANHKRRGRGKARDWPDSGGGYPSAPRKEQPAFKPPPLVGGGWGRGATGTMTASLRSIAAPKAEGLGMTLSERAQSRLGSTFCQDLARHRPSPYPLPQGEGAREFFGFADFFTGSFTGMTKERA